MKAIPLLGSMSIVGKDSLGRKILLPTNPQGIVKDLMIKKEQKKTSKIRKFINAIKTRLTSLKINPITFKDKYVKLKKKDYDFICSEYNEKVSERIFTAQETWKKNKRAEMGFNL